MNRPSDGVEVEGGGRREGEEKMGGGERGISCIPFPSPSPLPPNPPLLPPYLPSEGRVIQLVKYMPIKFQISILINKKGVKWGDKQKSGAFCPMQGPFLGPEKG